MPRRLAQQRMTWSDFEWPFHALRAISALAELLVLQKVEPFVWCRLSQWQGLHHLILTLFCCYWIEILD